MGFARFRLPDLRRFRLAAFGSWAALALAAVSWSSPGPAQTFSVQSIQASAPNLGKMQSAAIGDTVFRISSANGSVVRQSGTGLRIGTSAARALVTIACAAQNQCDTANAKIVIAAIGTPTKRAGALTNFNVSSSGATAVMATTPAGTATLAFEIGPVGKSNSKTFWVGMDFPIKADNSGLVTGDVASGFSVTVSKANGSSASAANGSAIGTVFRPIAIGLAANLSFGTISRPFAGNGSVMLDSATGNRTLTGQGVQAILAAPVLASYTVSGEGGQVFSVTVPGTFTMTGGSNNLTVTTNTNAGGTQILGGSLGSVGTFPFLVGGSFPLTSTTGLGAYSGSFAVTVQYN